MVRRRASSQNEAPSARCETNRKLVSTTDPDAPCVSKGPQGGTARPRYKPHHIIADRCGVIVVHSEWINRPATVIVDKGGIVRFAYAGTFWGDRPSIKETIDMFRSRHFEYTNPKRLPLPAR